MVVKIIFKISDFWRKNEEIYFIVYSYILTYNVRCMLIRKTKKLSDTGLTSTNTTDSNSDYSINDSSENNELSNDEKYYSSTNENSNESSIKDHDSREDYNSKGEYKPVDEMTQEEIKNELEETLSDALGLE